MVSGVRHSGTFPTKAHALAWEADKRTSPGDVKTAHGKKTCADAFKKYELEISKGKDGYRWEALRLASMAESSLGPVRMSDLNATHVAAWRDERLRTIPAGRTRPVQGATVTREMNLLSHVFSIARKEWKWISESPTADVARPKANPPRDRRITPAEIDMICIALGWRPDAVGIKPQTKQQRIACAFLFALETAMRAGEICALAEGDVVGRVARLHKTKNGLPRDVALSGRAMEIWQMVPEGFGITTATLDALFRRARNTTPIEGLTFHDTRHEAITRLAGKLNVLDLAPMVGHQDIRQLQTYYNATAADIAAKL